MAAIMCRFGDVVLPFVSIIIPVHNEVRYLPHCLGASLAQDYPADRTEILVADGGSSDGTRHIIADSQQHCPRLRLVENPERVFSTGFNRALREAQGDVIIMMGGHCEIAPDYVSRCVSYLQRPEIDCVGGPMDTVGETPRARVIALGMQSPFGVGGVAFRTVRDRSMEVDTVAFGAYKRDAIERCGPLDEEMARGQDDEYNYRLRKLGGRILLAPDVRCRYYSRSSLAALWGQYFRYGFWKVRVMQKHPLQMRPRQFVPPVFVAVLLSSALMATFTPVGLALLALVAVSYALANLTASVWTASRGGWRHLPLLPVVFAAIHLSYGLGFLAGLVRFANRWRSR